MGDNGTGGSGANEPGTGEGSTEGATTQTENPTGENAGEQTGQTGENAGEQNDSAAEIEKWKSLARKHEDRAKANADAAKELDRIRREGMSDTDKAVREAVDAALSDARKEFGTRLVTAEIRAASTDRNIDVDALLEGRDVTVFLDDEGEPDTKAIKAWLDKIAPKRRASAADTGQGQRGGNPPKDKKDTLLDALDSAFPAPSGI